MRMLCCPGCFSAGDTAEEAFGNVLKAIAAHCEMLTADDQDIPLPSPLESHQANPEFTGWAWALVDVDLTRCVA